MLLQFRPEEEASRTAPTIVRLGAVAVQLVHVQLEAGGRRENGRTDVAGKTAIVAALERVLDQMLLQLASGATDERVAGVAGAQVAAKLWRRGRLDGVHLIRCGITGAMVGCSTMRWRAELLLTVVGQQR